MSEDCSFNKNSATPGEKSFLNGSVGVSDICEMDASASKTEKLVSSSSSINDEGSCGFDESLRKGRRYPTRQTILAKHSQDVQEVIVQKQSTKEAPSPSNFSAETLRYPTRGSVSVAKQPQLKVLVRKKSTQDRAKLSSSKFNNTRICKSKGKHNPSYIHTNNTSKVDDNLNTKPTITLKRKFRSQEKPDSLSRLKMTASEDDMASWLQGTQFENFFIAEGDMENEVIARKIIQGILQIFQMVCTKLDTVSQASRVDLMTLQFLKHRFQCLDNKKKHLGAIPGIEIGDVYHYRAEMLVIGLHRNLQAGIGCINHGDKVVAASVVSCGGYSNAIDSSGVLIYSGAGGLTQNKATKEKNKAKNNATKEKLSSDQKLEGGNLALKNSIEACTPVRVIYGLKEDEYSDIRTSRTKKIAAYVYDGLYIVEKYWTEVGSNGFSSFKFQLRRISGQQETGIKVAGKADPSQVRRGVCIEDISGGKEKIPIIVVNTIDHELPKPFTYVTKMIYPSQHKLATSRGCECKDGCSDAVKCACVEKNGGEIPFNKDGAIVAAKPLVYECGPACKCPPSCQNRVSQHGIKIRLEVFKTKSMGWGVRSPAKISSGTFICEYIGEMFEDTEADKLENDDYLFDIGNNYNDEALWEGLSYVPSLQKRRSGNDTSVEYTIDAAKFANVGRFINHGCTPNLYAQNVLYDHDEQAMPHVMLFASEDIPPFEELTYHYNYNIDRVQGPDGTIKKKDCYCGSFECTGRLY